MNAKEARIQAENILKSADSLSIGKITEAINVAVKKGSFSIYWPESISFLVVKHFNALGYVVLEDFNLRDGISYVVKW